MTLRSRIHRTQRASRFAALLLLLLPLSEPAVAQTPSRGESRAGSRLLSFGPGEGLLPRGEGREAALRAFLTSQPGALGEIVNDAESLRQRSLRRSLLAEHYRFQQFWNGYPVAQAGILVSISRAGRVYRVIDNTYPVPSPPPEAAPVLDPEQALEVAWQHLRVRGPLQALPHAELVWLPADDRFRLVYLTDLHVQAPSGHWQHEIDAGSGEVLAWRDLRAHKRPQAAFDPESYTGPVRDRELEQEAFLSRLAPLETMPAGQAVEGSALVFDPDPPTVLMRSDLEFDSPAALFEPAYVRRPLLGQTLVGDEYQLRGPWVELVEFESPIAPPSTNLSPNWEARRGASAFTDVMTYFHIDRNQRYVQSLGYQGETGIYQRPVKVDADALDGDDQSAWDASSEILLFGHGCVPDNEDPTVLLHEYSHALLWDSSGGVVPGFRDDLGSISEGLSDYWAGSYRFSTAAGRVFEPAWVFPWDGHNSCWEGRFLDRTVLRYDPSRRYPAHDEIEDASHNFLGYSEELWSAPLFQSLLALDTMGVPREELDRIILEAQFGLFNGLNMRQTALVVLEAARGLEPLGPHVDVLEEKFRAQNILPEEGPGQDNVLWFPYVKTEVGSFTGLALANFSSRTISGGFTAYDRNGEIVPLPKNPSPISLPARRQSARLAEQVFDISPLGNHLLWLEFRSDSPRLGSFFQVGSDQLSRLDGSAPLSRQDRRIILSRVFSGPGSYRGRSARTRVTVVNPNPEPITIDMSLVLPSPPGRTVPNPRLFRQLPAHGFLEGSVRELFELELPVSLGYLDIRVSSGPGAIAFELVELDEVETLIGLNGAFPGQDTRAFSAQLASTPGLYTNLNLINTHQGDLQLRIHAVGQEGEELFPPADLLLNPGQQWAGDANQLFSPSNAPAGAAEASFVGSFRIESQVPGLLGDVIFGDRLEDQFAAGLLLQTQLFTHAIFSHLANQFGFFTGLALFCPGEQDAEVMLEVISAQGESLGKQTVLLAAGRRISQLLDELVPESAGAAGGYILVESSQSLVGQMLFATIDSRGIRQFSAVPPTIVANFPR